MDYLNSILERKRADLKKILPLEGKLRASAIQRNDYAGFRTAVDLGENRPFRRPGNVQGPSRPQPPGVKPGPPPPVRHVHPGRRAGHFHRRGTGGIRRFPGTWFPPFPESALSPVMARDVFIHPAMICQAIVSGADAVNLVAAALPGKGPGRPVPHGLRAGTGRDDGSPYPE